MKDDLDILDLLRWLLKNSKTIFIGTFLITIAFIVFAFSQNSIHTARIKIMQTSSENLGVLTTIDPAKSFFHDRLTHELVASSFNDNILNTTYIRNFFITFPELKKSFENAIGKQDDDELVEFFLREIKFEKNSFKNTIGSFSFSTSDEILSTNIARQYLSFVIDQTKLKITEQYQFELNEKIVATRNLIEIKAEAEKVRRQARIKALEESLLISKAIKLRTNGIDDASNNLNMEYMRGSLAIQTEIDILKNRSADIDFIKDKDVLIEELLFLKSIKIDIKKLFDLEEPTHKKKYKYNRLTVTFIGFVFGVMMSIAFIFMRKIFAEVKVENESL